MHWGGEWGSLFLQKLNKGISVKEKSVGGRAELEEEGIVLSGFNLGKGSKKY